MIHGIQRIQYQQAVRGGQAGFGAADKDGERALGRAYRSLRAMSDGIGPALAAL